MRSLLERASLVEHLTTASESFYYRTYERRTGAGRPSITTEEDWMKLPLIGKDDLLAIPRLAERAYLPLTQLDHVRASSGTTGKAPLFCPRTHLRFMEYRLEYHDFTRPIIAFGVPAMPHWHAAFQSAHGTPAQAICFDPKEPQVAARLARELGADALSVFAFHIPLIGPHLVAEGAAAQIRFIEIAGEACTRALYEYMRETFPNATVIPFYGSTEVEDSPIGMPCRAITGAEPLSLYHAKPSQYHELVDPETDEPVAVRAGAEGELVISAYPGEPASFPLIRFRTGDMVRVVDEHCARHGRWSFTVLGRSAMDFLKVPGGILRADEIVRALKTIPEVTDRFELHCREVVQAGVPILAPTLKIELRGDSALSPLAERIAAAIRVSPVMTYADGVAGGRYAPLICEAFTPPEGRKTKRIVRD